MFEIRFLGTAASVPTQQRSLSSAVVLYRNERFLIDCGEGTQRQILRSGMGFKRLNKILLTHRHLDHILGLGGLSSTLGRWGSMESMQIMGHPATLQRVRELMKVVFNPRWESNRKIELVPIEAGPIFETADMTVEAVAVDHRNTPTFGFVFQERARRHFLEEQANALGVPFGPERRVLVNEQPLTLADGRTIHPDQVLGEPIAGTRLIFISDVDRTGPLHDIADGADLLAIEGTYLHADRELARENGHITVRAAARLAARARVRNLVIHHVGPRYTVREILAEAHRHFSETIVVSDLDLVRIGRGGPLVWERWADARRRRRESRQPAGGQPDSG